MLVLEGLVVNLFDCEPFPNYFEPFPFNTYFTSFSMINFMLVQELLVAIFSGPSIIQVGDRLVLGSFQFDTCL